MAAPTILVAPLYWGLGHATRCIPVIDALLWAGAKVVLASDGGALDLLREQYPELPAVELPAYGIRYPSRHMVYHMARQLPRIRRAILLERRKTASIVRDYGIDAIISDNRYGVRHTGVPSVLLTHQLHLQLSPPWLKRLTNALLHRVLRGFDACWVPDQSGPFNLAGALAHPALPDLPTTYLGVLSRLERQPATPLEWDVLAVLSGPEPQRQYLEEALLQQLQALPLRALIVRGKPSSQERRQVGEQLYVQDFMPQVPLQAAMSRSRLLVARSGYTTLMDLVVLGCTQVLLVPTPGQPEQEYLAQRLAAQGFYTHQAQDGLDLAAAWAKVVSTNAAPLLLPPSDALPLDQFIGQFLSGLAPS